MLGGGEGCLEPAVQAGAFERVGVAAFGQQSDAAAAEQQKAVQQPVGKLDGVDVMLQLDGGDVTDHRDMRVGRAGGRGPGEDRERATVPCRAECWRQRGDLAADVLQNQCSRAKYVALIKPAVPMVAIERLRAAYFLCWLEALEEGDQLVGWSVAARLEVGWRGAVKRAALEFHVGVHVLVGRGQRLVPEP